MPRSYYETGFRLAVIVAVLSGCFAMALIGCNDPPAGTPLTSTVTVTGQVLDRSGRPLDGGIIQFISQTDPTMTISAVIAADGSFELKTIQGNTSVRGGIQGDCKVVVTPSFGPHEEPEVIALPALYQVSPEETHIVIHLDP